MGTPFHVFFSLFHCINKDFDIIHFHAQGPCIFSWIPKYLSPRKKLVFTCHGIDWQRNKWNILAKSFICLGEWLSAKLFDLHIMVSDELSIYYKNKYNINSIKITNGSNLEIPARAESIFEKFKLRNKDYLLSIGRLVPEKGFDLVIEAFKQVETSKKLVITGGSAGTYKYEKHLREIAKEDKRIIFTGILKGHELKEIYSNAYLYVSASRLEGLPLTLLESMSYGVPPLVSSIPPHIEMVGKKNSLGFLFTPENIPALKKKMEYVLSLPEQEVEKIGLNALECIRLNHNWDEIAKKHDLAYRAIVRK
jgi:glycosyltransferase involved in cell wall biosynthesis